MRPPARPPGRGRWSLLVCALITGALVLAAASPASAAYTATLSASEFEFADGNLHRNGSELLGFKDWNDVNGLSGWTGTPDTATGQGDTALGQGAKEDTEFPPIDLTGGVPNNKSDLTRFYTYTEKVNNAVVFDPDILYLGWERANTLGTANMDFEFNQTNSLSLNAGRTDGDILITFDFAGGGKNVDLNLLFWLESATYAPSSVCHSANARPCWGGPAATDGQIALDDAGLADGEVNDPDAGVTGAFDDTDLGTGPNTNAPGPLPDRTFGEAGIDLSAIFANATGCVSIGRAWLKSRSSDSFTSAVKDIIAPIPLSITNCAPGKIVVTKKDDATPT